MRFTRLQISCFKFPVTNYTIIKKNQLSVVINDFTAVVLYDLKIVVLMIHTHTNIYIYILIFDIKYIYNMNNVYTYI